jgi:hypothetical protein
VCVEFRPNLHSALSCLIPSVTPSSILSQVAEVDPDVFDAVLAAVVADDGEEEPTSEEKKEAKKKQNGEKRKRVESEDAEGDEEDGEEEDGGETAHCLLLLSYPVLCCEAFTTAQFIY